MRTASWWRGCADPAVRAPESRATSPGIERRNTIVAAGWGECRRAAPKSGHQAGLRCTICAHRGLRRSGSLMSVARDDRWKTAFRSLYYRQAPEPDDPVLERGKLALLVIDVQNAYL